MLPKSPLPPLIQFSSLENLKSCQTVEISFHHLFLTFICIVLYIFCPCQAQLFIFYAFGTLQPYRAYSSPYAIIVLSQLQLTYRIITVGSSPSINIEQNLAEKETLGLKYIIAKVEMQARPLGKTYPGISKNFLQIRWFQALCVRGWGLATINQLLIISLVVEKLL